MGVERGDIVSRLPVVGRVAILELSDKRQMA